MHNVKMSKWFLSAVVMMLFGCATIPSYSGRVSPVTFPSGNVRLSGILVEPEAIGPYPAVVFVHGSGPSTFDRAAWKLHANAFIKKGFAVLVYNKRGSAPSTGRLETADYSDLADDVANAVRFLRARADIRPEAIGMLGRSEAGWVAPMAAARAGNVAFIILSSGAAVTPVQQTLYALATEMRKKNIPESEIAAALALRRQVWDFYRRGATDPSVASSAERDSLASRLNHFGTFHLDEMPSAIPRYDSAIFGAAARMRFYDPLPSLRALSSPLLAVFGAEDESVEPASSIAIFEEVRRERGVDIQTKVFPGVGHSLMHGFPPRYATGYLDFISSWAAGHIR